LKSQKKKVTNITTICSFKKPYYRIFEAMKIGILRERKSPPDVRVALTPVQCVALKNRYPNIEIAIESCETRCFTDEEYDAAGISVLPDISNCDVLFGIKEIPKEYLIPEKTYFFFSHTIKKQPYNQAMLQDIIHKNKAGRL
jgi:saccharopine dehydrogenase (NAD+, L-lysine forming)